MNNKNHWTYYHIRLIYDVMLGGYYYNYVDRLKRKAAIGKHYLDKIKANSPR